VLSNLSITAARQRNQPRTTRSTKQTATLSGGWAKHRTRQQSTRSAVMYEHWAGIGSSVS
jgi:hypothetical protein